MTTATRTKKASRTEIVREIARAREFARCAVETWTQRRERMRDYPNEEMHVEIAESIQHWNGIASHMSVLIVDLGLSDEVAVIEREMRSRPNGALRAA